MKNVWSQHAIGIMFPIFVAFLLQQSMAFCSSFGYRYYSTRCWLVRHQLLTTNRWNKILRIHSGYDLSSGAVCRFCDSFLDSGHKKNPVLRFIPLWRLYLTYPRQRCRNQQVSSKYSYITLDIGDYHHQFLKISHKKGLAKAFQPCSNEYGMVWVKHF